MIVVVGTVGGNVVAAVEVVVEVEVVKKLVVCGTAPTDWRSRKMSTAATHSAATISTAVLEFI